ncbi:MAG: MFS transporter [bacterium]|nr:MFS transporter [bacterium]
MFQALQSYGWPMYVALSSQSLVNFINYVSFLFIPLIAIGNNLSLSEIAILFAVMRVPYLVNILIGNVGDKYNKKILITLLILAASVLFFLLGNAHSFPTIVAISFGLSLVVAIFQPIAAALILGYAKSKDKGLIAGMQEFTGKIGEIVGSLGFGILTTILGMHYAFQILGLGLFVLGAYLLTKKLLRYRTRDNEADKERKAHISYFQPKGTET